jgi:hypothetical protein
MVLIQRMLQDKSSVRTAILLLSGLFLGFAMFANLPQLHKGFLVGDQAVYYAMAQSLAYDGDLEYTVHDLIRYENDFWAGPNGVFLKRVVRNGQEHLYYAKSFAFALFAAPFVRVFGPGGPLVLHSLLLFLLLLMGWSYFSLSNSPGLSFLRMVTFLGASVACVYAFWITPEFFNLFLVFAVLFLWLYKKRAAENPLPEGVAAGRLRRFLCSGASDYLAAVAAGVVIFAKPTNVLLTAPLFLAVWLTGRKFWKAVALGLVSLAVAGAFFAANWAWTGQWNYQGGERKSFAFHFPLETHDATFDSVGGRSMTTDGYVERTALPAKEAVRIGAWNFFFYFFGRFTGVAWYFFPALLFLFLFFRGRKNLDQWLILGAALAQILVYIIMMPDNYGGGGGSLANRYFMNIYPMFLFLPAAAIKKREIVMPWVMAVFFLAPILITPLQTSASSSIHAKRFPFTWLPVEYTLINDLPTNTNPPSFRQQWGHPLKTDQFLYFLDDNFNDKHAHEDGWWTVGDRKADMILRTAFPVKEVLVHLLNNPRNANTVTVTLDGRTQTIVLNGLQKGVLRFTPGDGFRIKHSHQYRFKVRAAKGSIPYHEIRTSDEKRHLGVFFELEVIPR